MKPSFKNEKQLILLLLVFSLVLRLGVVFVTGPREYERGDALSYNGYALAILESGEWLTNPDFFGNYRPPVYPLILAAVYALFGSENFLAVYILQSLLSALICLYIYLFAKRIFNKKIALLAMAWSGFYIYYLKFVGMLIRESLIFFLMIFFFYHLYRYLIEETKRSTNFWFIIGAYCVLIHLDPRYIFYLPFLGILFVLYQPFWEGVRKYAAFLVITLLLLVPWTVRNYIAYDGFVLINTRTLDLRADGEFASRNGQRMSLGILDTQRYTQTSNKNYPTEEEREQIKNGLNPNNRSLAEVKAIRNDIYPATTFLGRKWFQFREFWRPFRFKAEYRPFPDCRFSYWSLRHNAGTILCYGILLPFMLLGAVHLYRERNVVLWFLIFPLAIQTLLHVLQWAQVRYRVPVDAFIIILAFYGLSKVSFLKRLMSN